MKKTMKTFSVLMIAGLALSFSSCKKSDDNSTSAANTAATLSVNAQQGTWKVALLNDNGNDETNHFTGYSFTFKANGIVTATTGSTSYDGTWVTGMDDSKQKMIINFASPAVLLELNDDWQIIESSSALIRLQDISGGNGGTDFLTFQKL